MLANNCHEVVILSAVRNCYSPQEFLYSIFIFNRALEPVRSEIIEICGKQSSGAPKFKKMTTSNALPPGTVTVDKVIQITLAAVSEFDMYQTAKAALQRGHSEIAQAIQRVPTDLTDAMLPIFCLRTAYERGFMPEKWYELPNAEVTALFDRFEEKIWTIEAGKKKKKKHKKSVRRRLKRIMEPPNTKEVTELIEEIVEECFDRTGVQLDQDGVQKAMQKAIQHALKLEHWICYALLATERVDVPNRKGRDANGNPCETVTLLPPQVARYGITSNPVKRYMKAWELHKLDMYTVHEGNYLECRTYEIALLAAYKLLAKDLQYFCGEGCKAALLRPPMNKTDNT